MPSASTYVQTGPKSARHLYGRGWLGLIPVVGIFAGLSLMFLAISKYKDKFLFLVGLAAMLPYFLLFFALMIYSETDAARSKQIGGIQLIMNRLVREIEIYKLQHKQYPDSLDQLRIGNTAVGIWDPMSLKGSNDLKKFNYQLLGEKYRLFSSGLDRMPGTKDDIFPGIESTGLGWVK